MATTSTAPFPYKNAYTDRLQSRTDSYDGMAEYLQGHSLSPITSDTYDAWRMLEHILKGIEVVARDKGYEATYHTVARLEFFWDETGDQEQRGVAIFDTRGKLIVHALHALLGYSGSGPQLSQQIMMLLGISEHQFNEIQESVRNQRPYLVVVSREKHDVIDGVNTAYPTLDVESTWEWWRVR